MSDTPYGWYCSATQMSDIPQSWLWGPYASEDQARKKATEAANYGDHVSVWELTVDGQRYVDV